MTQQNDNIDNELANGIERLVQLPVPQGPPDALIQATLNRLGARQQRITAVSKARTAEASGRRLVAAVSSMTALSLMFLFVRGFVGIRPAEPGSGLVDADVQPQVIIVSSAFVETDELLDGQTFLLPVSKSAVSGDPSSWPDELLAWAVPSRAETETPRRIP